MKRVTCPRCGSYITFDENAYPAGRVLVFTCPSCQKEFKICCVPQKAEKEEVTWGHVTVIENSFHHRTEIPLHAGDNVIGRYVKGTNANAAFETSDPSIDTTHCIITVRQNRQGRMTWLLRDAPSGTGTFYQDRLLRDADRVPLEDGGVITIGATTLIVNLSDTKESES